MNTNRWRGLRAVCAVVVGAVLSGSIMLMEAAFAQPDAGPPGAAFEGLWTGIDRVDGSQLQMSIVETDGGYEILLRDTFFSLCLTDGFTSGRGMDVGAGTLVGRNLLAFEFTQFCFSDADPATPVPFNVTSVDLSLRARNEVLVLGFDPEIYLHRDGN